MPVQATNIADVLITSLNQLGRLKFTDLMSDYQNTIALKRIFRQKKATIEDGPEVQFNIITDTNHSAEHVGIGYVNQVDIPNLMTFGKMPWRHTKWAWAVERKLIAMNRGRAKIIDIAQTQRIAALGAAILLFERTLWRCPTVAEFALHPVGIPYFVVKSSTPATYANNDGFNGGLPSDHTTVAEVNLTTYPRYKNYADAYTQKTKDDLIKKMRRARFKTNFMPLVDGTPTYEVGNDYGIYTNFPVVEAVEAILEAQNDQLGNDAASKADKAMLMRTPLTPVRELEQDTTDPVYMLNWSVLKCQALRGEWMHEQHFKAEASQPTISQTVTDCSWNLVCEDRRRQAVISNGTTMPN